MQLTYTPKLYKCTCCGIFKPESEFYRESYTDARTNQCKECINIKRKVQRGRTRHNKFVAKEKIRGLENVTYELRDWRDAMVHFHGACAFCGKKEGRAKSEKLDRDHLVAISRGGKTVRGNVIPACPRCNRGRGNRTWREWYPKQPFFDATKARRLLEWECVNAANAAFIEKTGG